MGFISDRFRSGRFDSSSRITLPLKVPKEFRDKSVEAVACP